jgi:GNAT superfamily N-acetyltransferase
MPLNVNGPHGATLCEVRAGDAGLLEMACRLFTAIFPEDRRYLPYIHACARGQHPSHPNTFDHVWLIRQDEKWVGLRVFSFITTRDFGHGAYVGFTPDTRGQGLGRWLAELTHEQLDLDARRFGKPGSIGFLGEVERPLDCETDEERRGAERRLQFHRRCGSIILPVPFIEPVMIAGVDYLSSEDVRDELPRPMYLVFNPSKRGREIHNLDLVNFVHGIYLDVYRLPPQHEFVRHSLSYLLGE